MRPSQGAALRQYWKDWRMKIINHLGGKCVKCGFSDWRALQVDHVNGGGLYEEECKGGKGYYLKIVANPTMYQLLCANCNWIKRYELHETKSFLRNRVQSESIIASV